MRTFTLVPCTLLLLIATNRLVSFVLLSRVRKGDIEKQLGLFKDIATKLKEESASMPTTAQVIEKMKRLDDEEFRKIDARIAKETAELNADHGSCPIVNYERDYSQLCPDGWHLVGDGSCWGERYKGPCESMHSFKWFTTAEKRQFEQRCCAFWPPVDKHPRGASPPMVLSALHGSVDPSDGHIVPPRV